MPNAGLAYEAVMDDGQRWLNEIELVPSGSGTKITKRAVSTYLRPHLASFGRDRHFQHEVARISSDRAALLAPLLPRERDHCGSGGRWIG
jgi:hypothetical protein